MRTKMILLAIFVLLVVACSKDDGQVQQQPDPVNQPGPEQKSSEKQLISFRFTGIVRDGITVDIPAVVNQTAKTISAEMPSGTNITAMEPEVEISDKATYAPTGPQDFTTPINYTVTAEDGTSRTYLVTIAVALSQKEILLKISEANSGNTLNWNENDKINDWEEVDLGGDGKVVHLFMNNKNLSVLPIEIGQLQSLVSLELRENSLKALPPQIGQLSSLQALSFAHNDIENLPSEVGELQSLAYLDMTDNELTALLPEIGQLLNLQILGLADNQLTDLPPEIGQLTKLAFLSLIGNDLSEIPTEIGLLGELRSLYLGSNALTTLPSELSQLAKLSELDLTNNELARLGTDHIPMVNSNPTVISCESNLIGLYLEGNKVPIILDDCICELDIDNGGTVDIDIVIEPNISNPLVRCQGDVIGK